MNFAAGTHLGRYEIRAKIGEGGMGEVYLAWDEQLNRKVVIKILRSDIANDPDLMRRLSLEAKTTSALNHPNILTIYEIGKADHRLFIVSEFIDGQTLYDRLQHSSLELPQALDIAIQVAAALAEAHKAGVIHRDIKPANIMVRNDDHVKVVDFGLAKRLELENAAADSAAPTAILAHTKADTILGTVAYMSPEQARGRSLDARTDIWSLGVVLYEMIAGHSPFAAETSSDTLAAILQKEPPSLLSTSAPQDLDWILTKALTKEREDRYQTAREMLTDLRRVRQRLNAAGELERNPSANRTAAVEPNRSWLTRKRVAGASVLLLLLLLVAGTVAWRKGWFRGTPRADPVVVLMDSPLADRVYDPETRKNGGTNADDITDILRDLPITIEKENTSPIWHREDEVLRQNPALIIIHRSCFAAPDPTYDEKSPVILAANAKLDAFLGYVGLANTATRFLAYTRRPDDHGAWKSDIEKRFPQLKDRIFVLNVPGGVAHATFRDPATALMLRQQVQSILNKH